MAWYKKAQMPSFLTTLNVCLVLASVAQIIHNERVKRDLSNYKLEDSHAYKVRHILIDHFRAVYMEQHVKFWLEGVKNHFLNTEDANITITIPEGIQKFYNFFSEYKKDVRNYFEQQFLDLPRQEKSEIKAELIKYIDKVPAKEHPRMRVIHKAWELETEVDHAVEDQMETIYDALDSVNVVADVNFYNFLRKHEDKQNLDKKVITPWAMGVYLHNLNEGLVQHVEKEDDYNVGAKYKVKVQERHQAAVNNLVKLNETYGGAFIKDNTTTEKIGTLVF